MKFTNNNDSTILENYWMFGLLKSLKLWKVAYFFCMWVFGCCRTVETNNAEPTGTVLCVRDLTRGNCRVKSAKNSAAIQQRCPNSAVGPVLYSLLCGVKVVGNAISLNKCKLKPRKAKSVKSCFTLFLTYYNSLLVVEAIFWIIGDA
jgi:hypothetical protein